MRKRYFVFCLPLIPTATALLVGFSSGPLPQLTGGFQEQTCVRCHASFSLNEGRTRGGDFHIQGVPKSYQPGRPYRLTLILNHPGQSAGVLSCRVDLPTAGNRPASWWLSTI